MADVRTNEELLAELEAADVTIAFLRLQVDLLYQDKNAVYAERNKCVALIARMVGAAVLLHTEKWDAWRALHDGDEWDDDWRNVIFVRIPTGQLSWHIHDSELWMFEFLPLATAESILERPHRKWDGHSTEQKYERILRFCRVTRPANEGGPSQSEACREDSPREETSCRAPSDAGEPLSDVLPPIQLGHQVRPS